MESDINDFLAKLLKPIVDFEDVSCDYEDVEKEISFRERFIQEILLCFKEQYVVKQTPKTKLFVLEIV